MHAAPPGRLALHEAGLRSQPPFPTAGTARGTGFAEISTAPVRFPAQVRHARAACMDHGNAPCA